MKVIAKRRVLAAASALAVAVAEVAVAQIVTTNVEFPRGSPSTTVKGAIAGDETRDYVVSASAGQAMRVTMTGSSIVYFNVLPPGNKDEAIFVGSTEGNSFSGTLGASGAYKIRVYQMRATARRGERGNFSLAISVMGSASGGSTGGSSSTGNGGGSAKGISGIAGMSSIAAIDEMTDRGFRSVDSFETGNTQYGIFYDRSRKLCVQLTMADGKVLDAKDIHTHPKCH